jgi:hypothetical protein
MMTVAAVRKLALSFEEAVELPHFDRTSFRVRKKIYATMLEKENIAVLMLSPEDQSVFCAYDPAAMYPVPNKWGKKGSTMVDLKKVRKDIFKDALRTAYCRVAPKGLAIKYQPVP